MKKIIPAALAALGLLAPAMAQAALYTAVLTGPNEAPGNTSPAVGVAAVNFDETAHTLFISLAFAGLEGGTTAAHIHCCTDDAGTGLAGVATETPSFAGFPAGLPFGAYAQLYNTALASTWSDAFLSASGGTAAGAEAAFGAGLLSGTAYLNIHTTAYPGGEIRGFLGAITPVPEPSAYLMLGLGIPLLGLARRRRNRAK